MLLSHSTIYSLLGSLFDVLSEPAPQIVKCVREAHGQRYPTDSSVSDDDIGWFLRNFAKISQHEDFSPAIGKVRVPRYGEPCAVDSNAGGPWRFAKPVAFVFGGKRFPVTPVLEWRCLILNLCKLIAEENPQGFDHASKDFCGARRTCFATPRESNRLKDGKRIGELDMFVETNLSANNAKLLCDRLMKYFDYGEELEIEVRGGRLSGKR